MVFTSPTVLSTKEGLNQETPLCILLKHKPDDIVTVDKMIQKFPACASIPNRQGNTPLHLACQYGASIEVVRRLYSVYPKAAAQRNFHGLTPLQVALQHSSVSNSNDLVAVFLNKHFAL